MQPWDWKLGAKSWEPGLLEVITTSRMPRRLRYKGTARSSSDMPSHLNTFVAKAMRATNFVPVHLQCGFWSFHVQTFVRFRSLPTLVDASRRPRLRSARAVHRCEKQWRRPLSFQPRNATAALDPRSVISRLIISLRRRHRLICCQLVDLIAFLVEAMSGQRTEAAAQNRCLFKLRLQIPLIHNREQSISA